MGPHVPVRSAKVFSATDCDRSGLVADDPDEVPHAAVVGNSLDRAVAVTITVDADDGRRLYRRTHTAC